MKRLTTLFIFATLVGTMFIPAQAVSAQSSGPEICEAARHGGTGNQVVLGTDGDDVLRGGSGNDILCGFDGDDVLRGGSGNDILVGGPGTDELLGGTGGDTLYFDDDDIRVNGGSGSNQTVFDENSGNGGGGEPGECEDFENLARSNSPSLNFRSEEQCQAFVDGGGALVPRDPNAPEVFIFDLNEGNGGGCEIGVGLRRFGSGTHSVTVTDSTNTPVAGSPFSLSSENDPTVVLAEVLPGVYTATASTGGQTYSHTVQQPTVGTC